MNGKHCLSWCRWKEVCFLVFSGSDCLDALDKLKKLAWQVFHLKNKLFCYFEETVGCVGGKWNTKINRLSTDKVN